MFAVVGIQGWGASPVTRRVQGEPRLQAESGGIADRDRGGGAFLSGLRVRSLCWRPGAPRCGPGPLGCAPHHGAGAATLGGTGPCWVHFAT